MRKQKRVEQEQINATENGWVSQYTMPKKLKKWEIDEKTPLLNKLKEANPSMQVTVVHHNGIFAVVVHFENHCFCDCHWCLTEADAAIALGLLEIQKQFKKFVEPHDFF